MGDIIVVDCETSGLEWAQHSALSWGWWNIDTGESGSFIANYSDLDIELADPESLKINDFENRIKPFPKDVDNVELGRLHQAFMSGAGKRPSGAGGHKLLASNPGFDAGFLSVSFARAGFADTEPWHYHLIDLGSYAAGKLDMDPGAKIGLARCAELLGVPLPAHHGAWEDTLAAGECVLKLRALQRRRSRWGHLKAALWGEQLMAA